MGTRKGHRSFVRGLRLELERLEDRISPAWTPIGPVPQLFGTQDTQGNWSENVTGRITALAFGQADNGAAAVFVGAAGGGVFRSGDFQGANPTWTALTDFVGLSVPPANAPIDTGIGLGAGAIDVGAITVDPTNPKTVYVGTGEADAGADARYGTGILKSTDGGDSFTLLTGGVGNPFFRASISKIIVDPTNPNTIYASVVKPGQNGAAALNQGIYKNTFGGQGNWQLITGPNNPAGVRHIGPNVTVTDLEYLPNSGGGITLAAGVTGSGVWTSTDNGASWTQVNLPRNPLISMGAIALAADHTTLQPAVYAAVVDSQAQLGVGAQANPNFGKVDQVFRSMDGGNTWNAINNVPPVATQNGFDLGFALAPGGGQLYLGGVSYPGAAPPTHGIEVFNTQANSWRWIDNQAGNGSTVVPHTDVHTFAFYQGLLYAGTDGGLWRYHPAAANAANPGPWDNLNTPPAGASAAQGLQTNQVNSVALQPGGNTILSAIQDNAFARIIGSGPRWNTLLGTVGTTVDGVLVRFDPTAPNRAYLLSQYGRLQRVDNISANTILPPNIPGTNISVFGVPASNFPFRSAFTVNPQTGSILIASKTAVYEMTNANAPWKPLSTTGLPNPGTITSVTYAPGAGNMWGQIIYVGYANGQLFRSDNDGGSWTELDEPWGTGTVLSNISSVVPDPQQLGTVYVTLSVFGKPQVWVSHNSGALFLNITGNLYLSGFPYQGLANGLPNIPVNTLVIDTTALTTSTVVYVGTDVGVYRGITDSCANSATFVTIKGWRINTLIGL